MGEEKSPLFPDLARGGGGVPDPHLLYNMFKMKLIVKCFAFLGHDCSAGADHNTGNKMQNSPDLVVSADQIS